MDGTATWTRSCSNLISFESSNSHVNRHLFFLAVVYVFKDLESNSMVDWENFEATIETTHSEVVRCHP